MPHEHFYDKTWQAACELRGAIENVTPVGESGGRRPQLLYTRVCARTDALQKLNQDA